MLERAAVIRKIEQRDLLDEFEAGQLAVELDDATPQELIAYAMERWGSEVAICTSFQSEGMAILDMAWRIDPRVRVFTVDTGRLPQETYDVMEEVRQRYGVEVEVYFPDARQIEGMVRRFGPNLFQKAVEARLLCCNVRKVEPIRGVLEGLDAWITGLRRDQWASRANIRKIEVDHEHGGLAKINPLADWTLDEVKAYNIAHAVPEHPLYAKGYTSIGCSPCTRATAVGEDPRAGRWWWEKNAPKECG
ncbi:MAG TPA: phosphoadenylyl-sulfate reductase, partial [Thermoanaerobaculia bacterium]|nr:phosphoadenylyl-sulfate reductase [Thermoanaerobaculia bacterium]